MITNRGTITGLCGHPLMGLWHLVLTRDGVPDLVYIESGYGVRNLAMAFGATEDGLRKVIGQEIIYSVDDYGLLSGFTPVGQWEGPEINEPIYEEEK